MAEKLAVPFLETTLDIIGFRGTNDEPPIIGGSVAEHGELGPADVTWTVHWDYRSRRDKVWADVLSDRDWIELFSGVPGGTKSYLKTEAKFADEF